METATLALRKRFSPAIGRRAARPSQAVCSDRLTLGLASSPRQTGLKSTTTSPEGPIRAALPRYSRLAAIGIEVMNSAVSTIWNGPLILISADKVRTAARQTARVSVQRLRPPAYRRPTTSAVRRAAGL